MAPSMMLRRTSPESSLVVTGKTFTILLPLTASLSLGKSNYSFLPENAWLTLAI